MLLPPGCVVLAQSCLQTVCHSITTRLFPYSQQHQALRSAVSTHSVITIYAWHVLHIYQAFRRINFDKWKEDNDSILFFFFFFFCLSGDLAPDKPFFGRINSGIVHIQVIGGETPFTLLQDSVPSTWFWSCYFDVVCVRERGWEVCCCWEEVIQEYWIQRPRNHPSPSCCLFHKE